MNIKKMLGKIKRNVISPFIKPICDWPLEKRVAGAMRAYARQMGHTFDLSHPVLFTEKRVWYALYYEHPDMTRMYDKYLFKAYIEEKLGPGYTAPLYGMWTSVKDLERDWDTLPDSFMLKSNCSNCSRNIKRILDKNSVDKRKLFRQVSQWLNPVNTCKNDYMRAYYDVTPRIIAEKILKSRDSHIDGGFLDNYKVQCFGGVADHIICASANRKDDVSAYDPEWNKLPVKYKNRYNGDFEKPPHLAEMLEIATKLSQGFPQIRVDFYEAEDGLYVGELTLYSIFKYESEEWDRRFGEKFILPDTEQV